MIPLVETGGSPYEIGHDVGRAMSEQLAAALAEERERYPPERTFGDPGDLLPFLEVTEVHAPDCLAELQGMADGAGVSFHELFAANAGAELDQAAGRYECSVAGIAPAGTTDGHVLLAHNEDSTAGWGDYAYLVKAAPNQGPAFVAFTYAGHLLHQGVNSAGIGSVGNALYARDAHPGIPKLLLYRLAINQTTLEGAIRAAIHPQRAFGNNHLFATADGDLFDVEVSGETWQLIPGGNRYLVHTNHFIHPDLNALDQEDDLLNSRLRYARLDKLIESTFGSLTLCDLQAILADHANYPKSLCKHHTPESDLDYGTIGSVVIDVTTRTLRACAGNPCRNPWREVSLA